MIMATDYTESTDMMIVKKCFLRQFNPCFLCSPWLKEI